MPATSCAGRRPEGWLPPWDKPESRSKIDLVMEISRRSTWPVPLDRVEAQRLRPSCARRATDSEGRTTTTELQVYALGEGYTAWRRYDHQRIDLLPEKTTYKPGETARILIQSPWEQATALITTEREGIRPASAASR